MENSIIWEKSSTMDAHSFVARNFAHLYAVGGRQRSIDAVAKMHRTVCVGTIGVYL